MQIRRSRAVATALALAALGCGGPKETLVPVSGTIKIGGQPAAGVRVMFRPLAGTVGNGGSGVTDEDGAYELTHYATQEPGISAGKYSVHLSLFLTSEGKPAPEDTKPRKSGAREKMPREWTDVGEVGDYNTVTVPEEGGTFDFDVSDQAGGPAVSPKKAMKRGAGRGAPQ